MSRPLIKTLTTLILASGLSACQMFSGWLGTGAEPEADPDTLAALQAAEFELPVVESTPPSVQEVISSYEKLLPLLDDPQLKLSIQHRLADLSLERGENLMAEKAVDEMQTAIDAYTRLLAQNPQRERNDEVLYQLAKAYDLKGMSDAHMATLEQLIRAYPKSAYWVETQFRRGELLFSEGDYLLAQEAFEAVLQREDPKFQTNAWYMRGWSQFKQANYSDALQSFVQVLDAQLPAEVIAADLAAPRATQAEDVLRVMGLSFSYLERADSVTTLFARLGGRPYEVLVYDRYANLLLEKEQYSDAMATWRAYIARHAASRWAAPYQIRIIETLQKARFLQEVHEEKVRFVETYGIRSTWWAQQDAESLDFVRTHLQSFLPELADRHYVLGQTAQKSLQALPANSAKRSAFEFELQEHFQLAAHYYAAFIETFPQHPQTPERVFLLAESQLALQNWLAAIEAFAKAGYDYPHYPQAAEAAFAVLSTWQSYAEQWQNFSAEQQEALQTQRQAARLRFVAAYPNDLRAAEVLLLATQFEFERQRFDETITYAEKLLNWPLRTAPEIRLEAQLLQAHSLYALARYAEAERAYSLVLQTMAPQDKRYLALRDNLAACVYKQGEQALQAGNKAAAVEQFLRVGQVAPDSSIRANAEYDAASYLIELQNWPRAIKVLTEFRARYPQHELIHTVPAKLALSYRESEQWTLAADELKRMIALAKTDEEKRDTLYIAAELYDRAKNDAAAIESYRSYANTYRYPADVWGEAVNRLAELYQQNGDREKRQFWLKQLIQRVDQEPTVTDDRLRYLAASAANVFADEAYQAYSAIKLKLPLEESLEQKTVALQQTMAAYEKVASYGISAYSTEAGYRMAEIYAVLSRDLMDSDRPDGLNELEMEQYDILLEEQAFPFEESAIDIHEQNASRVWQDIYDDWVKRSFESLRKLLPGRYDKPEIRWDVVETLTDIPDAVSLDAPPSS